MYHRVGLVSFKGDVHRVLLPLTYDLGETRDSLRNLGLNEDFSSENQELNSSLSNMIRSDVFAGDGKQLVLVLGNIPKTDSAIYKHAMNLKADGLETFGIGVGPSFFSSTEELKSMVSQPVRHHTLRTRYRSLLNTVDVMLHKLTSDVFNHISVEGQGELKATNNLPSVPVVQNTTLSWKKVDKDFNSFLQNFTSEIGKPLTTPIQILKEKVIAKKEPSVSTTLDKKNETDVLETVETKQHLLKMKESEETSKEDKMKQSKPKTKEKQKKELKKLRSKKKPKATHENKTRKKESAKKQTKKVEQKVKEVKQKVRKDIDQISLNSTRNETRKASLNSTKIETKKTDTEQQLINKEQKLRNKTDDEKQPIKFHARNYVKKGVNKKADTEKQLMNKEQQFEKEVKQEVMKGINQISLNLTRYETGKAFLNSSKNETKKTDTEQQLINKEQKLRNKTDDKKQPITFHAQKYVKKGVNTGVAKIKLRKVKEKEVRKESGEIISEKTKNQRAQKLLKSTKHKEENKKKKEKKKKKKKKGKQMRCRRQDFACQNNTESFKIFDEISDLSSSNINGKHEEIEKTTNDTKNVVMVNGECPVDDKTHQKLVWENGKCVVNETKAINNGDITPNTDIPSEVSTFTPSTPSLPAVPSNPTPDNTPEFVQTNLPSATNVAKETSSAQMALTNSTASKPAEEVVPAANSTLYKNLDEYDNEYDDEPSYETYETTDSSSDSNSKGNHERIMKKKDSKKVVMVNGKCPVDEQSHSKIVMVDGKCVLNEHSETPKKVGNTTMVTAENRENSETEKSTSSPGNFSYSTYSTFDDNDGKPSFKSYSFSSDSSSNSDGKHEKVVKSKDSKKVVMVNGKCPVNEEEHSKVVIKDGKCVLNEHTTNQDDKDKVTTGEPPQVSPPSTSTVTTPSSDGNDKTESFTITTDSSSDSNGEHDKVVKNEETKQIVTVNGECPVNEATHTKTIYKDGKCVLDETTKTEGDKTGSIVPDEVSKPITPAEVSKPLSPDDIAKPITPTAPTKPESLLKSKDNVFMKIEEEDHDGDVAPPINNGNSIVFNDFGDADTHGTNVSAIVEDENEEEDKSDNDVESFIGSNEKDEKEITDKTKQRQIVNYDTSGMQQQQQQQPQSNYDTNTNNYVATTNNNLNENTFAANVQYSSYDPKQAASAPVTESQIAQHTILPDTSLATAQQTTNQNMYTQPPVQAPEQMASSYSGDTTSSSTAAVLPATNPQPLTEATSTVNTVSSAFPASTESQATTMATTNPISIENQNYEPPIPDQIPTVGKALGHLVNANSDGKVTFTCPLNYTVNPNYDANTQNRDEASKLDPNNPDKTSKCLKSGHNGVDNTWDYGK